MNDDFGQLSYLDQLPDQYGDGVRRVVQRVGLEAPLQNPVVADEVAPEENPHMEAPPPAAAQEDYSGLFGKKKDKTESSSDGEKGAFWANLTSALGGGGSSSDPGYRELPSSGTDNGYRYKQYADNSIEILQTPSGRGVGTKYAATTTAAKNVKTKYGAYPASSSSSTSSSSVSSADKVAKGAAVGAGVGAGLAQLLPTLASMLGPQTVTPYDEEFEEVEVESGTNWGLVIGGVALVGLVGGAIYMAARNRDDEDEE